MLGDEVARIGAGVSDDLTLGLAQDRERLVDLIGRAALAGAEFEDVTVFEHRSAAIKRHLPGPLQPSGTDAAPTT